MRRALGALLGGLLVVTLGVVGGGVNPAFAAGTPGTVDSVAVTVEADGSAPFQDPSVVGGDHGPNDGMVRSNDSVIYRVALTNGVKGDIMIESTLPDGQIWDPTATAIAICNGPEPSSISADGRTWKCSRTTEDTAESFPVMTWVRRAGGGSKLAATVTAGGATGTSPEVEVIATPKTEIRLYAQNVLQNSILNGEKGTEIQIIAYAGATYPKPAVGEPDFRGYEALEDPYTYVFSVPEGGEVKSAYASTVGGGTIATSQPGGPGTDVTVTVTGARTDYSAAVYNSAVRANYYYTAIQSVFMWVPNTTTPAGVTTPLQWQLKDFHPLGTSGEKNFGIGYAPGQAPGAACEGAGVGQQLNCIRYIVDRTKSTNVTGTDGSVLHKKGGALMGDNHVWSQGQEKIAPGQSVFVATGLINRSDAEEAATDARGCLVWDNALLELGETATPVYRPNTTQDAFLYGDGNSFAAGKAVVEYSSQKFANDAARKAVDCGTAGDGASGWSTNPTLVGGLGAVTAIRVSYMDDMDPATAYGLQTFLKRTVTTESLNLSVNAALPWFWQYGTEKQGLVKSTYNPAVAGDYMKFGGQVQAVPALVRSKVVWSPVSVKPGVASSLTITPAVFGPVVAGDPTGMGTVAKDVTIDISLNSVCAEPQKASLDALVANGQIVKYDYTPGVGACKDGAGTPAKVKLYLGDVEAAAGAAGGTFHWSVGAHQSNLPPLSIAVANSIMTQNLNTHTARVEISSPSDSSKGEWTDATGNLVASAKVTDRTEYADLVLTGVASFSAGLTGSTASPGLVGPSETFSYSLSWGNSKEDTVGKGSFVALLPYDNDGRGTTGLGASGVQVQSVTAAMADPALMGTVGIKYTVESAAAVKTKLDAAPDGSTITTWQTGTPPVGATALLFQTSKDIESKFEGSATITVKAPSIVRGSVLVASMYGKTAMMNGLPSSVVSFSDASRVSLRSNLSSLAGKVWRDVDFDGALTGADKPWDGVSNVVATPTVGVAVSAVVGPDGSYMVPSMVPGEYVLSLQGASGWNKVLPVGAVDVEGDTDVVGVDVLMQERVADPVLKNVAAKVSQGAAVSVDVSVNDELFFPVDPDAKFTRDGIKVVSASPTSLGGTVVLDGVKGTNGQSQVKYTAPATWPASVSGTSFVDTVTYSFTNAVGVTKTATLAVTVYQRAAAVDDAATIKFAGGSDVDVLANDKGDGLTITTVTGVTGKATAVVNGTKIAVTPDLSYAWGVSEASYTADIAYTVTDSQGLTSSAKVVVTVVRPPVIAKKPVVVVGEGKTATADLGVLNAGQLDKYEVAAAPSAGSGSIVSGKVQFVAPVVAGSYVVKVRAIDKFGQSSTEDFTFRVQAKPTATGGTATIALNQKATFAAAPVSTGTIKTAVADPAVGVSVTPAGSVVFDASGRPAGEYKFTVTYTDDLGQTGSALFTVVVKDGPAITGETSATIPVGGSKLFHMSGTYATSTVTQPSAGTVSVDGTTGKVTYTAGSATAGVYTFTVVFKDSLDQTMPVEFTVTVQAPPTVSGGSQKIVLGGSHTFAAAPETTGTMSTAVVSQAPTQGSVSATPAGVVSFDGSAASVVAGVYKFEVTFTDQLGQSVVGKYEITVQAPPTATGGSATIGLESSHTFQAAPVTTGMIESVSVSPALSSVLADKGGKVEFRGGGLEAGVYGFTVTFMDDLGQTGSADFTVTVKGSPSIGGGDDEVNEDGAYAVTIPEKGEHTFTTTGVFKTSKVEGNTSAGTVTVTDSGNVTFEAKNSVPGVYTFRVVFEDEFSQTTTVAYAVTVQGRPIVTGGEATIPVDGSKVFQAAPQTTGTIATAEVAVSPSAGVVTADVSGEVVFTGTGVTVGTYTFTVVFTDDLGQAGTADFTVVVSTAPIIDGGDKDEKNDQGEYVATVPMGGTHTFTTSGVFATSMVEGDDFAGEVSVASNGNVTYAAKDSTPGVYSFRVVFADAIGQTTTLTYKVTVQAPPTATGGTATIGLESSHTFQAAPVTSGMIESVSVSPALSSVLADKGGKVEFRGAGLEVGTYAFTVTFTDQLGQTGSADFTVTVKGSPSIGGGDEEVDEDGAYAVTIPEKGEHTFTTTGVFKTSKVEGDTSAGRVTVSDSGNVTFEAKNSVPGVYTFRVVFEDEFSQTTTVAYAVTVQGRPIVTGGEATIPVDGSKVFQAAPVTTGTISRAEVTKIPAAGTVMVDKTGEVRYDGAGVAVGTYTFEVTFTDDLGQKGMAEFVVTVSKAPVIDGGDGDSKNDKGDYTAIIPMGGTHTFTTSGKFATSSLMGLEENEAFVGEVVVAENGNVRFEAGESPAGEYAFRVEFADGAEQSMTVTYVVVIQAPPVVVGDAGIEVEETKSVTVRMEVSTSGTIVKAEASEVPEGTTVSADTAGSVTFATGVAKKGSYSFKVTYTDQLGQATVQDFSVVIAAQANTELVITRYSGADRYETSLNLNSQRLVPGAPVFVATGGNFPDSLSAGPAVTVQGGALVLSNKGEMKVGMLNHLVTANPSAVYIMGGTGAISAKVETQLKDKFPGKVKRVGGVDRYETSAMIAQEFFRDQDVSKAFIASGANFPDALTASAVGGALKAPVLLAGGGKNATALNPAITSFLSSKNVKELVIAGGEVAVGPKLKEALDKTFTVSRQGGADRYATNLMVNAMLDEAFPDTELHGVWLAAGANFPDALSAAVPAGQADQRLVLSKKTCVSPTVLNWVFKTDSKVNFVGIVGGTSVLSDKFDRKDNLSKATCTN